MLKKYCISLPSTCGNVEEEWQQCLQQILTAGEAGSRALKLNIFVDAPDYDEFLGIRSFISRSVLNTFGDCSPAFNITVHPPEKPWKIVVEGLYIQDSSAIVTTRFTGTVPYVVIKNGLYTEVWGAGLGNVSVRDNTRKAAMAALDQVVEILKLENLTYDNVVRQWNYIGNILEVNNGLQNYQVFNEVRSEYYKKYRTIHQFPAATGVGMKLGNVFLDFCAVEADESVKIIPVDNPDQVNAYEYGQQVLKGSPENGKPVKHPPQFERALLLSGEKQKTLFISGTASIIGQETIGIDDVAKQTIVTIGNIKKLADNERLACLCNTSKLNGKYSLIRVYVKSQNDFETVRSISNEYFPSVPAVYIVADICRNDLLTETEAEYQL